MKYFGLVFNLCYNVYGDRVRQWYTNKIIRTERLLERSVEMKYFGLVLICVAIVMVTGCDSDTPTKKSADIAALSKSFPKPYEAASRRKGGACNFDKPKAEGSSTLITGWAAISTADGTLPEMVVLGFKVDGEEVFAITKQQQRDDVAKYFSNPRLVNSGFQVYVDKKQLKGAKTAMLYQLFQGKIYTCEVSASF